MKTWTPLMLRHFTDFTFVTFGDTIVQPQRPKNKASLRTHNNEEGYFYVRTLFFESRQGCIHPKLQVIFHTDSEALPVAFKAIPKAKP
jgi:hypothetical protein